MPPKKKSGKKEKKGKKSSAKPLMEIAEPISASSKEFYLLQISDLEYKLSRYQQRCDELEIDNKNSDDKYQEMEKDKLDIVRYLKKTLEQRVEEIEDLNDRLLGLQETKDSEKEKYEKQLQTLKTEFTETKDKLTSEIMVLNGRLAGLEDFRIKKDEMTEKLLHQESMLKQKDDDHKNKLYELERKAVIEKDRLKKEMIARVNQVAKEFRAVSNKQMVDTTKRTIRENASIRSQLSKMSDKVIELVKENDDLTLKVKEQTRLMQLLKSQERLLTRKKISNEKVIRMLTEKCKALEIGFAQIDEEERRLSNLVMENSELHQTNEEAMNAVHEISKKLGNCQDALGSTQTVLEHQQKKYDELHSILQACAAAIEDALEDRKSDLKDLSHEEELEAISTTRENMLEHLIRILDTAVLQNANFKLDGRSKEGIVNFGKENPEGSFLKSGLPRNPVHYRIGDLGFVPLPETVIPTKLEKCKQSSPFSNSGPFKDKPKKVATTQTAKGAKAMFLAEEVLNKLPKENEMTLKTMRKTSTSEVAGKHR